MKRIGSIDVSGYPSRETEALAKLLELLRDNGIDIEMSEEATILSGSRTRRRGVAFWLKEGVKCEAKT